MSFSSALSLKSLRLGLSRESASGSNACRLDNTDGKGKLPKVRHDDNGSVGLLGLRFFEVKV